MSSTKRWKKTLRTDAVSLLSNNMIDGIFRRGFHMSIAGRLPLAIYILLMAVSCVAQKNNSSKSYYHEDLYQLRPRVEEVSDTASSQTLVRKKEDVVASRNVNGRVDVV